MNSIFSSANKLLGPKGLFLILFLCIDITYSIAQTGPGGIGSSSNNILWLRAEDLSASLSDGAAVTSWTDNSGNSVTATQGTASLQPTYNQSQINGRDVVTFDGSDALDLSALTNASSNYSAFIITNNTTNTYIFDSQTGRTLLGHQSTGAYYDGAWRGTSLTSSGTVLLNWFLDTTGGSIYVDGTQTQSGLTYVSRAIGGATSIGSRFSFNSAFTTGDIAEVVMYNSIVNSAQRIIIENYLGSKYGLTVANDFFAYDTGIGLGFNFGSDLVGIGRVDASNTHTSSTSDGMFTIANPSGLGDGEYLFVGHDDGSMASWSTSEVPGSDVNIQRISREWKMDETGDVGTIDITFNTAALPVRTTDYDFYQLWIDDDGDFSNGATALTPTDLGGNDYQATGVDVSDGQFFTISIVRPELSFTTTSSNGFESATTPSFSVSLNYALYSNVTVDYADDLTGTASNSGTDYTFTDATLTINAGSTSGNFSATLNNESDVESDETFIMSISNPSNGQLGASTTHTFTINDDDNARTIDFSATSSNGNEDVTPVVITVQINSADGSNPTSVDYALSGTATGGGVDYTLAGGTATIPAGVGTSTTLSIVIADDLIDDEAETIVLTLSNPVNANLGTNTTYTYTINDNDASPTVEFLTTSSFGNENVSPASIVVSLSVASGQDVTVDYADALSGTATGGGIDYLMSNGTLTIPAGNTSATFDIQINDESTEESPETIIINISSPSGATLGTNTSHTLTIGDDDNSGFTGPGGVGDSNNNILWLKASDLSASLSDGAAVPSWTDNSGNSVTATQGTGSLQPTYNQAQINGQDVVTFDGGDALDLSTMSNGVSNYTAFFVTNNTTNTYIFDSEFGRTLLGHQSTGAFYDGSWKGTSISTSGTVMLNWFLDTSGSSVYIDGTQAQSGLTYTAQAIGGATAIGSRFSYNSAFTTGDIGEAIIYNTVLNSAQRIIIENYLGSKYGLTIATDVFSYDTNIPGGIYENDVAGIGRVDASNFHPQTQSAEMLGFNNADGLGDNEYLMLGHDNGSISAWTSSESPDGDTNIQRIAREWRVDETGDVGNVNIELDITNLPALPAGFTQYAVFLDADGDFSSGATVYQATLSGSLYIASSINIADGQYMSIGIIRPVVSFTSSSSNDSETNNPNIEISLNYSTTTNVTVDYARSAGTASSGVDFNFTSGTATILAGQTTANIQPGTLNDTDVESDETIIFDISNPSGVSLGATTQHTYTINDEDNSRKIDFSVASANGDEDTTPVTVTVQINNVDGVNPTTVDYAVTGGTASGSSVDFTLASGTATVVATQTTTTFDIAVANDLIDDEAETIIISLSNPTNSNLGTNQTYTFTINDDDAAPTIEFLTSTSFGSESATSPTIDIVLSSPSGQDVTVDFADALSGTATNGGIDYLFVDGTATITAGATSTTIGVTLNDDSSEETPETVVLNLSSPSGATLGTNTSHTFTIGDDDNSGFTGPGGVGDSNNNILWLRADDLATSLSDGAAVTTWTDNSGNSIIATQGSASLQPTYNQSQIHGQDVVTFDGGDALDLSTLSNSASNYTAYIITNNTTNTYIFDSETGRTLLGHQTTGAFYDGAWKGTSIATSGNVMLSWFLDTSGSSIYVDGTQTQSSLAYTARAIGGASALGSRFSFNSAFTTGDIAEVVLYNTILNNVQRILVDNYLGSKYGLTIANDVFSYDANIPGSIYGNDVAGIGRIDPSNIHPKTQSGAMLGFSNSDDLDNDEYLLIGHDKGSIATWTSTEVPDGDANIQRIAREWRMDETGDVGNVNLEIEVTGLPALPAGYTQYAIFTDADGDFSSGATVHQATLTGSLYVASAIDVSAGLYVSIGIIQPVVSFTSASSNDSESNNPNIEISLNYSTTSNVTVDYARSAGTASTGLDFNFTSGTATILAGQTTANIQPGTLNDTDVESDETIIFDLSNPTGVSLGSTTQHTYTINDDDNLRKIDFALTSANGDEDITPVSVTVQINNVDAVNPTTVDYTVTGGTASGSGVDYTLANGTATVVATQTTTTFDIVLINDLIDDEAETIIISLSNPTNSNLDTNQTYTFTINDDDAAPTIEFLTSTSFGSESTTSPTIDIVLSSPSGQDVTVDFADALSGTATNGGIDYLFIDGTATITAGMTSTTIGITLNDDSSEETPETVILNLSSPSGATLGSNTSHTFTIGDDDNSGFTGPGGVGDSNNNILWLRADDLAASLSDGAAVTSWTDNSGNSIVATQGSASLQPTYNQSQIHGQDVVTFDGGDALDLSTLSNSASNYTAYIITNNTTNTYILDSETGRTLLGHQSTGAFYDGAWKGTSIATSGNVMLSWFLDTSGSSIYVDGTQTQSGLAYTARAIGGATSLGSRFSFNSAFTTGDIAEVVLYNTILNNLQRVLVENYLGSKYGFTIANDVFSYDTNIPGQIYGNDVAGIGRIDASNIHPRSQSSAILGFSNADDLGDNEYLLIGHDKADITAWTSTEVPGADANIQRIAREWRMDETGDVGNVNLEIDVTDLPALPAGYTQYAIFTDADGDFSSGATVHQATLTGSLYVASAIDVSAGLYVSIGIIQPVVLFTSASSNDLESSNPNIEISLNYSTTTNITVDYARSGGTASNGVDFNFTSGTATILAGQTTTNILPGTLNDTDVESDETIIFDLSNPTGVSLGSTTQHTYTINDDDNLRKIDFAVTSANGDEDITPVSVAVQINNVDAVNPTTVDYTVTGGTASGSGVDFTLASGTAIVAATQTTTTFDFVLINDLIDDEAETIIISLSNPTNSNLGTNQTFTFTINDNDDAPTIEFLTATSFGSESLTTPTIDVVLSSVSGQDVTVDFADALSGTATNGGLDYLINDGTITITAGNTSETISLTLNDDSSEESPETVILNISSPSGATLGANTSHTFTIGDNDNSGFTGPGGVGDNNTNILWLRAGDLSASLSDGAAVTSWADNSGNSITGVQSTGSLQPTYNQGQLFGQDVVTFDGGDAIDLSTLSNPVSNYTTFIVTDNSTNTYIIDSETGRTLLGHQSTGAYYDGTWQGASVATSGTVLLNWFLDTSGGSVYVDGTQTQNSLAYTARAIGGATALGSRFSFSTAFTTGDIAEVVMYNTSLSSVQRILVENYLGSKYGLTIANDFFSYDANIPGGTYFHDVAGIGRIDASTIHPQGQSAGMLGFNNADNLGDNEYLLLGHDLADITAWTASEVPNGDANLQRIAREWRMDETGDVGNVNIELDATNLPALPAGYTQYAVFVDADGDFSSGATVYQATLSGSLYIASNIDVSDGLYVTIGIIQPVISFSASSSNGSETSNPTIEISLNFSTTSNVTVDYARSGGTATNAVDFNFTDGTATILAGQTTTTIQPGTLNDTDVESDETLIFDLSNPTGVSLGTTTQHTYSINDDDNLRKIDFLATAGNGDEGTTPVTVTVQINNTDAVNPTTVDYAVTGGTASASGVDFTLASGTASISATNSTTTFDFIVTEDLIDDDAETIIISLSNPTNSNLGTNQTFTYTIDDNDSAPTVEFLTATSFGNEGSPTISLVLSLSIPSGQDITVDYADALSGTATNGGIDYLFVDGTATITAGMTSETIDITLNNDTVEESPETVIINISNPSGASLGTNTSHTFTIGDNDNTGSTGPAGVGDDSNNILWLTANDLSASLSDGAAVTSWADISGNSVTGTQSTGSLQPTYNQAQLNGHDVVTFDGGDAIDLSTMSNAASNYTTFVITDNSTNTYIFDSETGRTLLGHQSTGAYYDGSWQGTTISTSGTVLLNWILDTSGGSIYVDGTQTQNSLAYTARAIGGASALGSRFSFSSAFTTGDIAEVIMYNTTLNSAQRVIVENYLGNKYGLTVANDLYTYQSTHPNDLAGIGRADVSNTHTGAQSAGILTVGNSSDLGDGEYLLFGHDNGDIASWTTTEAPNAGDNTRRIAREWRLDETGDLGTVSITIDNSLLSTLPSGFSDYVIWIDSDGDFSSGATQYLTTLVSSSYVANGVAVTAGDFVAIGTIKPVIAFTSATSSGFETTSNSIEVSLSYALGTNVTVDYDITGGTATNGSVDYNLTASGTVTIFAGQTTANLFPGVINDTNVESDETIEITLSNPSSGLTLGANILNTYSINDDDNLRKIDFLATTSSGSEATTPATITIQINNLDASNPTTVDYTVTGGTATGSGEDFTLASGTATVAANTTTTTFDIVIDEDVIYEGTETIIITLADPTNSNLGTNTVHTYSITDNDTAPTVQFASSTSTVAENSGTLNVEVTLSAASGQDIMVDFADATTGTATASGTDYSMTDATLTFSAGSTSETFAITLIDDSSIESPETIDLSISNPIGGATLGSTTAHTATINDNDNSGSTGPGGVGDNNNNILWLRAEDLSASLSNGAAVTSWTDNSGNAITATQGTGSLQPTYNQALINGRDVVTFDGGDALDLSTLTHGTSNYSTFIITNNTAGTYIIDSQTGRTLLGHQNTGAYYDGAWQGTTVSTSGTVLLNWVLDTSGGEIYVDGTQTQNSLSYTARAIGGATALGSRYSFNSAFTNGDIAEVVMYNTVLNTAQRIIVENYLGAKYGITIANDNYAHQAIHSEDVAGIGRVDASNQHTAAQSTALLQISNASDLGDGEYAIFGHDNTSIASWTASEVPGLGVQRIAREWRIDETGDVGTVSITVDVASLPTFDATYSSYIVFVDGDGDFTAGATCYGLALIGGSEYGVSNVVIADGDYITIAEAQNISAVTGDFDDPNSWVAGVVPTSGDEVTITGGTVITMTDNHTVGTMTVDGTLSMDSYTLTLDDIGGTPLMVTGTLNIGTGTVEYAGNGAQCVTGITYNNLTISGTGTKTLCGNIDVDGDLNISSTLDTDSGNDYSISLAGDWGSTGTFDPQGGTVTFDGTATQNVPGAGTVTMNNVVINKASNDLSLGSFMVVNGTLTLTSGDIVLNSFDLTIGSSGNISGGGSSSYIQADNIGTVIKNIASTPTSITFQVGDSDEFSPFSFTLNSGTLSSANVSLNLRDAKQVNVADSDYITRYWTLSPTGITTPDYNVSYNYLDADIVGTESNLGPAKYNGAWENGGTIGLAPNLLAWSNITSFSDFTADGSSAPLPVVLINFDAFVENEKVILTWSTASETDNDFFTIERSENGVNFEALSYIPGAGNSNSVLNYDFEDKSPLQGVSYYRLKQTDFDGQFEYSDIERITYDHIDDSNEFVLYPNPSKGGIINIRSNVKYLPNEEVLFRFTSLSGKLALERRIAADSSGNLETFIDPKNSLSYGVYIVTGVSKFHHSVQPYIYIE